MSKKFFLPAMVIGLLGLLVSSASGRRIENWPYERLFKEADLVVIAKAQDTTATPDRLKDNPWKEEFLGQTTAFTVKSVLKGKPDGDTIKVLHYKLQEGRRIESGPLLLSFRTKGLHIKTKQMDAHLGVPDYLLFLKVRKDRRYEPVSGPIDPKLSVREIYHPLPDLEGK